MWIFGWKGQSGFSARSTAEAVTRGIDASGLTAVVTGPTIPIWVARSVSVTLIIGGLEWLGVIGVDCL
ncbi:hypothetical protein CDL15_Pgr017936 [Punica granatum]|uniref:Uncharacterized protein n=1 Tax=Punica granatum TaxID=22663 RepID=A0A218WHL3_PUNGR|nr:hypothetical protein CDL15_Pgr017936 [Punica granatum]